MINGIVTKAYGGFFFVSDGKNLWRCTVRGVLKHRKVEVMVGDRVSVLPEAPQKGLVLGIFPRRNALVRPPVANVDQAIIVFSIHEPEPSLLLLDRFLIQAGLMDVRAVICINKTDLAAGPAVDLFNSYKAAGYKVIETSTITGAGLQSLKEAISDGVSVFAGPSGVGKSSLLNALHPGLFLKTGDVGHKLKRGKHTTRHVELLPFGGKGGFVADTPGFSSLYLPAIKKDELAYFYPEISKYINACKFNSCLHNSEPGCAVKEAVAGGKIDQGRYGRYLEILNDLTAGRGIIDD